ncbi:hypothetical protein [Streptomyces fractus]|uniref:hypothetical protein n=1 Tax=Streptomyces fractus TaxID=641806 RepID=UPI003CE8F478
MAKVIAHSGVTVELSGRDVELVREALSFSLRANTDWLDRDDEDARDILGILPGGVE